MPRETTSKSWGEIFAALDDAEFPDDFLADRAQGFPLHPKEVQQ